MADPSEREKDPTPDEPLAARLRRRYGVNVDPEISLASQPGDTERAAHPPGSLSRLGDRTPSTRYRAGNEIARGGMGAILKVWDEDLRRELAMKVALNRAGDGASASSEVDAVILARFIEEAQITGQLDHPGIVPVHELGLDDEGHLYFTMRLVKGRDLSEIFELVALEQDGWNRTRALGVMLRVCEAMAFAHAKGVIHRDLKPANIMVGRFGEVYVMDWGLARVLGKEDRHDVRIREVERPVSIIATDRHDDASRRLGTDGSELHTMDGDVIGTPAYMAPEQARGKIAELDERTDVYSVGAMLYRLLAGRPAFASDGDVVTQGMVLMRLLDGPPRPLSELDPDSPAELVAITEKAMAREPSARYADMRDLAEDLRAFLENRVVAAYEAGALAELRKWVRRNRVQAAALAAVVLTALAALGAVGYVQAQERRESDHQRKLAIQSENEARVAEQTANENAEHARRERAKVLRLSALQRLASLETDAAMLWPVSPKLVPEYDSWIARADGLVRGLHPDPAADDIGHYAQLEELRGRAASSALDADAGETWTFDSEEDRWWHAQLEKLVRDVEAFSDAETGLVRGSSARWGWGVAKRRALALELEGRTVIGPEPRVAWAAAIRSIADVDECPEYGGLKLAPQLGLLPVGRDPTSGLWEFADVLSGDVPMRLTDGRLDIGPDSAMVFVLIPGGSFEMGAQGTDPERANFDAASQPEEEPVHTIELAPFLISKFEMTQGQWSRFAGANPSRYDTATRLGGKQTTLHHPVESVSWHQCSETLARMNLALPTEAQWEYAARAGTETPWSTGLERETLIGSVNLADRSAALGGAPFPATKDWPELEDGWVVHAEVGSFAPNRFGLHDVHGNVREWCREGLGSYDLEPGPEDGARPLEDARNRVFRGGSFTSAAAQARSAYRGRYTPEVLYNDLGVRPIRELAD